MKTIRHWLRLWPELIALPLLLFFFFIWPYMIHYVDPEAGTFDNGWLQVPMLAIFLKVTASMFAFLGIKYNFPAIHEWYKYRFDEAFDNLKPLQKLCVMLGLYAFYLLLFALLIMAIPKITV